MSNTTAPHAAASLLYNLLIQTAWLDRYRYTGPLWRRVWQKSCALFSGPVRTTIHGRPAIVNYGHTYPVYARKFRSLNNPLVELVYQSYSTKHAPITLVDVGANVGDTVLLLESNCPGMIGSFYCVEGDLDFARYLRHNVGEFKHATLIVALLSSAEGRERELLRTHAGTASAQGVGQAAARTLDSLLIQERSGRIDVLKTDVDGFDGKVLLGAKQLLEADQPAVIFEWHPILCRRTGNNWTDHIEALRDCGYTRLIWFTKYGEWSHFSSADDRRGIDQLADFCLRSRTHYDWHYDVVALHERSTIAPEALADLAFARARRSPH
jgi:FkbM family methyltransferase